MLLVKVEEGRKRKQLLYRRATTLLHAGGPLVFPQSLAQLPWANDIALSSKPGKSQRLEGAMDDCGFVEQCWEAGRRSDRRR